MAKLPCAGLTKPIRPIVTDRPTETMNSTMPAATPPRSMLATSTPKITERGAPRGESIASPRGAPAEPGRLGAGGGGAPPSGGWLGGHPAPPILSSRAGPDLLLLAGVLDPVDLADDLLEHAAVLHDRLGEVLVHHNIAGGRVDYDGAARARELPAPGGPPGAPG